MSASSLDTQLNVLVTGGAGFIGTHLCRELIKRGHRVVSLDLKTQAPHPVTGVKYLCGDARDRSGVTQVLKNYDVDAVYHLAATVSVPLCQQDPVESYSHNVNATLAVLEACRMSSKRVRIAFASSAALYGNLGDTREALSEHQTAPRFSSFYAAQKHACEKMIELYADYHQMPALMFRFFNVYGHGQDPSSPYSGVITIFSKLAKEKRALTLYNSGIQTRDFIPVTDIAYALVSALNLSEDLWDASILNLGSGTSTSVLELAEMIREITGSESEIVHASPREGDVLHSLADIRRARELLGLKPSTDLSARLSELLTSEMMQKETTIDSEVSASVP